MAEVNYAHGRFPTYEPEYLTARELAGRWHMSPGTLANWRSSNKGPAYIKVSGSHVLYPFSAVKGYEAEHFVNPSN